MKTLGYLLGAMGYVPDIIPLEIADIAHGNNFVHEIADYPATSIAVSVSASTTTPNTHELALAV